MKKSTRPAWRISLRSRAVEMGSVIPDARLKALRRECVTAIVPFRVPPSFIPALIKSAGISGGGDSGEPPSPPALVSASADWGN